MGKTHILALLVLIYEQNQDRYASVLPSAYSELQQEYLLYLKSSKKANSNAMAKKAKELFEKKNISETSEIWEQLGLQVQAYIYYY